jgi:hypothetical protein
MKHLSGIILLFIGLASYAQTRSIDSLRVAPDSVDVDSSEIGKPIGDAITKTIGPEGGKIISADGLMELTFPPGAVAAPTSIGIQAISNTSLMNFGKTYACTPDGLHFQRPVGLILHYSDTMAKGIATSAPVIRWQDKSGRWSSVTGVRLDSVAHTLASGIEHFSNYSGTTSFKLFAETNTMKVGRKQLIVFMIIGTYPDGRHYGGRKGDRDFWKYHNVVWSVSTGTIERSEYKYTATYTAPAALPDAPARIQARYTGMVAMADGSFADGVIALTTVDIYDEYHYTFTGHDKMGHLQMIDSASCDIRAYSSGTAALQNIQNPTPWSDWPPRLGQCSYTYPDKTSWKGLVEITGMTGATVDRTASETEGMDITIFLAPALGSSPPYTARCKGDTRNVPTCPVPAYPTNIWLHPMPSGDIRVGYGAATGLNRFSHVQGGQGFEISASRVP